MIVSAHLLPHSPLLLPSIGKDDSRLLNATRESIEHAGKEIQHAKPDTILLIGSHGTVYSDAFSLNLHDPYVAHFEEFGDFSTRFTARPDLETAVRIKRHLRVSGVSYTQHSEDSVDYASAVTLSSFVHLFGKTRVLLIAPSKLDAKSHFEAGLHLSEVLLASKKRFSIICSADLSQRLTPNSPGGYSKHGEEFDEKIRELIQTHNILGLLKMDPTMIAEAGECAYRPLLMMLGIIEAFPYQTELLSYESPFGVGELVARFHLG